MAYTQDNSFYVSLKSKVLVFLKYNYNVNQDFHGGGLKCNLTEMISFPEINCTRQTTESKSKSETLYYL